LHLPQGPPLQVITNLLNRWVHIYFLA
jgi:hypothetical protein